ncbi:MAG: hypothetical protein KDA79_17600 [Planctomycetaceae bacterium]|nr:hypothetical protein [Planctomycetaceae bacterium]
MPAARHSSGDISRPEVSRTWSPAVRFCGLVLLLLLALGLFAGGFALTLWGMGHVWGALFIASGLKYMALVCVAGLLLMGPGLMLLIWVAVAWWLRFYGE